jgi:hypothetical protein
MKYSNLGERRSEAAAANTVGRPQVGTKRQEALS